MSFLTDQDAPHFNIPDEYVLVDQKATPANADRVLLEDSADGFAKKYADIGDLPGGGGGGEFINAVRDYGATGNGTTDDTTALQNAIDAAETIVAGGPEGETVTVYIPAGTYIAEFLTIEQSGIRILMDPETILKQKAGTYNIGSDSVGIITVKGTSGTRLSRVFIEGGVFDGNKANVTSTGSQFNLEGLAIQYADDCHVVRSRFVDCYSDGIDWDFSADCTAIGCYAENSGGWGFHVSLASTRIRLIDCDAVTCGHDLSRGGFDQWGGSGGVATNSTYLRCRASGCYQNFDIDSSGAHIGAIRSEGTTTVANNFSGVSVNMDTGGGTVTANAGEAVIENPDTDIVVNHGAPVTPDTGEIQVTAYDAEAAASDFWVSAIDATSFQLNVASTPTVEATFGWLWVAAQSITPAEPALLLWLDADAITGLSDTDPVATWADQSGLGNDFTQATGTQQPLYRTNILNGLPVVRFDGSNDRLTNAGLIFPSGNNPYTVIAVVNWTNDGAVYGAGGFGSTNQAYIFRKNTSGRLNDGWWANNLFSANSAVANSTWYIIAAQYNQAGRALFLDDLSTVLVSDTQTVKNTQSGISIVGASGTTPAGGTFQSLLGGDIAELRIYDGVVSVAGMAAIQAELETKWGL